MSNDLTSMLAIVVVVAAGNVFGQFLYYWIRGLRK